MRSREAMDGHTGDILTYFGVIPNKGRPWAGIGLALAPYLLWCVFKNKEKEHILPLIWTSVVLVLYSLVKTKLHWYIMPIYPALAVMTGWACAKIFKKYTIPIVSLCALVSLGYLTLDKQIFDLDYSPRIKQVTELAISAVPKDQTLFMYEVTDPSMLFYLGGIGVNVHEKESLREILKEKGSFVVLPKSRLKDLDDINFSTVFEKSEFILIKTE